MPRLTNQELDELLLANQIDVDSLATGTVGRLVQIASQTREALLRKTKLGRIDTYTNAHRVETLRQLDGLLVPMYDRWGHIIQGARKEVIEREYASITAALKRIPAAAVLPVPPKLPIQQLRSLIERPVFGKRIEQTMRSSREQTIVKAQNVLGQVITEGGGGADATRAIRDAFSVTHNQADVIARTTLLHSANDARVESYKGFGDLVSSYSWLATLDSRTCLICGGLDGQEWAKLEEATQPPRHPRCVPGDELVYVPNPLAAMRSRYEGVLVEMVLDNGQRVRTTRNHPLLGRKGFAPAYTFKEGDVLLGDPAVEAALASPTSRCKAVLASDLFDAIERQLGQEPAAVVTSPEDLHGDARFGVGTVDVVWRPGLPAQNFDDAPLKLAPISCAHRIVEMWLEPFEGLVYTFQDRGGYFFQGGGIYSKNCRCILRPNTPYADDDTTRPAVLETEEHTTHHRDGSSSTTFRPTEVKQVPGKTTYKDFFLSRPEDWQRNVLGRKRFEMWQDGTPIEDILGETYQSRRRLTVEQYRLQQEPAPPLTLRPRGAAPTLPPSISAPATPVARPTVEPSEPVQKNLQKMLDTASATSQSAPIRSTREIPMSSDIYTHTTENGTLTVYIGKGTKDEYKVVCPDLHDAEAEAIRLRALRAVETISNAKPIQHRGTIGADGVRRASKNAADYIVPSTLPGDTELADMVAKSIERNSDAAWWRKMEPKVAGLEKRAERVRRVQSIDSFEAWDRAVAEGIVAVK